MLRQVTILLHQLRFILQHLQLNPEHQRPIEEEGEEVEVEAEEISQILLRGEVVRKELLLSVQCSTDRQHEAEELD
jgi:hypothetical protein